MPQTRTAQNHRAASAQRKPNPFQHIADRFFLSERNVSIAKAAARNMSMKKVGLRSPVRFDRTSQPIKPSFKIKIKGKNSESPVNVPIKFIAQAKSGKEKVSSSKPVQSRELAANRRVAIRKKSP